MGKDEAMNTAQWYRNAVFYEIYLRSFQDSNGDGIGDLKGLISKIAYLKTLGIDCIWLLPIYVSPRRDDGYDIADYYTIDPVYGDLDDFRRLVDEVHQHGLKLIMDLVLNHTSDQHAWFQAARADRNSPFRDYYVWSDTDQKYKDARIIFLDTEKSNWSWDEAAGQYFWHRFYSSQPDLNYENPAVQEEMLRVTGYWLDFGIDGFRVDAVPYLYEREGANCENLPETHRFLKKMRAYVDAHYPGKVLVCEANQYPQDVLEYLGDGDEFHMAFNFPLMPKTYMSLRRQDRSPMEEVIRSTPAIPDGCQWGTFLRNHDELTLEMVTHEERQWMWQEYAPEARMRQNLGIRRRLAPLLDNNPQKIELAHNLLFSLPGSPFLYYGDEIGMGDDIWLPDRNGVRTPMQWDATANAGFSAAEQLPMPVISAPEFAPQKVNVQAAVETPNSIWKKIQRLIQIRKTEAVFQTNALTLLPIEDKRILGFRRANGAEEMIFLHNLSETRVEVNLDLQLGGQCELIELLTQTECAGDTGMEDFSLEPFQSLFLKPKPG
jgi:maltose alpha-D-glucosyltransferase/alpha-amylase